MDQDRFDRLVRTLGVAGTRRAGLRAALGGLLGVGAAAASRDADAGSRGGGNDRDRSRDRADADADRRRRKKRKKTCKPACAAGFECVKVGKKRACQCPTGVTCGDACCRIGQACQGGQCVTLPGPGSCIAGGEPCKNVGRTCCDGRVCASGQGGDRDVACYVPKTGACTRTDDCVYGMACRSGRCEPPQPGDLAQPCDTAAQQLCTTPGATCTAYTGTGAPGGAFCTLPLQKTCTGDPDCTCYKCWYTPATVTGQGQGRGRDGRSSTNVKACCHVAGNTCTVDQDCCLGLSCAGGLCTGQICTPDSARGCGPSQPCCNEDNGASCQNGVCETCGPATCPNGCCQNGQCVPYGSQGIATCGAAGAACAACPPATSQCKLATCSNAGVCGESNKPLNDACDHGGGTGNGFCDGSGTCVQCTNVSQCSNTVGPCQDRACTAGACTATNKALNTACTRAGGGNGYCNASSQCVECTSASQCTTGVCASEACSATAPGLGQSCYDGCTASTCLCTSGICIGGTCQATGCTATGGTTSTADGYTYHRFTTNGTLAVSAGPCDGLQIQYVLVGGGGGGGNSYGGGGGGGVVTEGTTTLTANASVPVTVGTGGNGGVLCTYIDPNDGPTNAFTNAQDGGRSRLGPNASPLASANGGVKGESSVVRAGAGGASGSNLGGTYATNAGGGGGGAGGAGTAATSGNGGNGGPGKTSAYDSVATEYGGGGGGGGLSAGGEGGTACAGDGGVGTGTGTAASAQCYGSGGGGGGKYGQNGIPDCNPGDPYSVDGSGKADAPGFVIVRYRTP